MKYIKFLFLLVISVFCGCSQTSTNSKIDKGKLDSFINLIEHHQQGMGSISVFEGGIEVYQNSFGYASIEDSILASTKTKYRVGSITKIFTASIIMQLIEENKLELDSKLNEFFPEIPNADKITIEHMLRHRSGLYNFTGSEEILQKLDQPFTRSNLIEQFIKNGTVFEPDEKTEYSNTNYHLLGYIAEDIEQKSFRELIKTRITEPLNLSNTYIGGKINPKNNEAFSYTLLDRWYLSTETHWALHGGAGALVSNPTDIN